MTEKRTALDPRLEAAVRANLPQWNLDVDGHSPEAALLSALGALLEEGDRRLLALPEGQERAFLRGFGEERRGAAPARACAALAAPEGRTVPAGTPFYLSGDGKRVWRTERDAWAGPTRLTDHFITGGGRGKVLPLPLPGEGEDVPLFDFRAPGAARREARFSHRDAFASQSGCSVTLTLARAPEALLDFLAVGGASWFLEGGGEPVPVTPRRGAERSLTFTLPSAPEGQALLLRIGEDAAPPAEAIGRVTVSTARRDLPRGLVLTDDGPCPEGPWLPFGETPEPWRTCHISGGEALALRGAEVTLSWTVSFQERTRLLPGQEKKPDYKPVMRALPPPPPEPKDVWADSVAWEYWNGRGWRPLPGAEGHARRFGPEGPKGPVSARFRWPEDAEPLELLGETAFYLRWRVRSAEGNGWLPRRDHPPEVADLRLSAVLEDSPVTVEAVRGLDGGFSPVGEREALFPAPAEPEDAWWLGFDPPPEGGTLSLYLSFRGRTPGHALSAWEAFPAGERPLPLKDGTEGLAHDGVLTVSSWAGRPSLRFGKKRWWLCLRPEGGTFRETGALPRLTALSCGAVRLVSDGGDGCGAGEPVQPLRGGSVSGVTLTEGFGGGPEETEAAWVRRSEARRRLLGRAVSEADVEELLRCAFPDVVRARCKRTGTRMEIAVLLRDVRRHDAALALRAEDIRRLLETDSALPSLGLSIRIRPPVFYPLRVSVWVRPPAERDFSETKRVLTDALASFLHPATGNFHGNGWRLGTLPTEAKLKSRLREAAPETADLDCMAETPEGTAVPIDRIHDPFALPLDGGDHTLREVTP